MYADPHRHYHNQQHIADCLTQFDQVRQLAVEPNAVEFAVWLHEAGCDSHAGNKEDSSAKLAQDWLKQAGAAEALTNSVGRVILATKVHDGALHPAAPLLADVDLSILGRSPQKFWEYEQNFRHEYGWVNQKTFATKRVENLQHFLARPRLYHTKFYFARLEAQARSKVHASIEQLQRSV